VTGPNCYVGEGVGISNTPEKCAAEVMEMFCGKEADVLISCGGGELMCEILEHVDFRRLAQADPKWFMGYSDNTNLVYPLVTLCDTAAIYGPCAAAFGMEPWHSSIGDAYQLLTGEKRVVESYPLWEKESLRDEENPLQPYHVTEPLALKVYAEGRFVMDPGQAGTKLSASGRLLGGCMDCLVNLLGTGYDGTAAFCEKYKEDGILWMLEACDLNVMSIRRAMWQMEQAGWFQYAKGFLIGRPYCHDGFGRLPGGAGRGFQVPCPCNYGSGHRTSQSHDAFGGGQCGDRDPGGESCEGWDGVPVTYTEQIIAVERNDKPEERYDISCFELGMDWHNFVSCGICCYGGNRESNG